MTSASPETIQPYVCGQCRCPLSAVSTTCPSCQATRPRGGWPLDPHLGRLVAERYRLVARLGAGGMGEVYQARDESPVIQDAAAGSGDGARNALGEVVVKLLAEGLGSDETRRFLNEAKAARSLTNPHVVKIYDFGFDEGRPFLVMELLEGQTLRALLDDQGRLPIALCVELTLQVAEALEEVHGAGIVHRDLKPENLMLTGAAQRFVKLLDFGAARMSGPDATQSLIGTPRYMAPEQLRQQALDDRTDIYALGACLFEMLAGRPPYDGKTLADCLEGHLNAPVPRLREQQPDVDSELAALVSRMLSKDPANRPRNMREVQTALRGTSRRAKTPRRGLWITITLALAATITTIATIAAVGLLVPSGDGGSASGSGRSSPAGERRTTTTLIIVPDSEPAPLDAAAAELDRGARRLDSKSFAAPRLRRRSRQKAEQKLRWPKVDQPRPIGR